MTTRMTGMKGWPLLPLFALAGIVACSDVTGTGSLSTLNETALADYKAMDDLQQSSGWKNFRLTAAGMRAAGGGAAGTSGVMSNLVAGGGRASIQLVSDTNLGKTYQRLGRLVARGDFTSFRRSGLAAAVHTVNPASWGTA